MKSKILVVDDEPDALELIGFNLKRAGFDVVTASDGAEALRRARESPPALVVLDLMLPELDGLQVCRLLRGDSRTASIPIIMLTAKAGEIDRVLGLELGADDYLTKPFRRGRLPDQAIQSPGASVANSERARSAGQSGDLRRRYPDRSSSDRPSRHQVSVQGKPVELTALEFKLLMTLAQRRGRVQTRERLLCDVWEYDAAIDTRTVDTHVRRLRDKLGPAASCLDTVRGVGYRFVEE
jgi:DNA-binding response OmpR family regulator